MCVFSVAAPALWNSPSPEIWGGRGGRMHRDFENLGLPPKHWARMGLNQGVKMMYFYVAVFIGRCEPHMIVLQETWPYTFFK